MVQVTIGELVAATEAMRQLMAIQMPIVAAHRMGRAAKPVADELAAYEKSRLALFEKYGTRGDDGLWHIIPGNDDYQAFEREYFDLLGDTVALNIQPVAVDSLGDVQVTPSVAAACWFLFE